MKNYNFADQYRAAGISPGPEIIGRRQDACAKLKASLDFAKTLDLVRLYYGLSVADDAEWFRIAFAEADPSFTMVENKREAAVLAACILASNIESGDTLSGLATVVASVAGHRSPVVCAELLDFAEKNLGAQSISSREHRVPVLSEIRPMSKSKVTANIDALADSFEVAKVKEVMKSTVDEAVANTKSTISKTVDVLTPMVDQLNDLREEIQMLWWYVGGWSRIIAKPFAELDSETASIMAGIDLAHLSLSQGGPLSAKAILQRVCMMRTKPPKTTQLGKSVDKFPQEYYSELSIPETIQSLGDVCPILFSLRRSNESPTESAWSPSFKKLTGLESSIEFTPANLSYQVYREYLLLTLPQKD